MSFARIAVRAAAYKPVARVSSVSARCFTVSAVQQKDVIQDLLIKELKQYKPVNTKVDDSQVKELKLPTAPAVPQVDADLSEQLSAYDAEPEEATH